MATVFIKLCIEGLICWLMPNVPGWARKMIGEATHRLCKVAWDYLISDFKFTYWWSARGKRLLRSSL